MSETKKGLGRGLSALLGDAPRPAEEGQGRRDSVRDVPIAQIRPNPAQPRQHFDEDALAELAESIRQHGVLQPILLRPVEGGYELIAGERRSAPSCTASRRWSANMTIAQAPSWH
jgi:ParB family chromosome partitioning protein